MKHYTITEWPVTHFFTADRHSAIIWLAIRLYVGWQWLSAGIEKLSNPAWVGADAGSALAGFIQGTLGKTGGAHPDVQLWYASFLREAVLPNVHTWSYAVVAGECLVGAALICGFLVGLSAFFGGFMNLNFMLAGSVSTNPILFTLAILLMLSWRVAGWLGADRVILPLLARRAFMRWLPIHLS
ncbi:MAG TPA: DoxX family protein [Candidatus Paceibacterota bacterium]|nr:DoxX family protein [Candidatus Paceibacterota bacterium]